MKATPWKSWSPSCAAFICADHALNPAPRAEHAAYIGSWLKALKDDKRAIFAAAHAQRAADYLAQFSVPAMAAEPERHSVAAVTHDANEAARLKWGPWACRLRQSSWRSNCHGGGMDS